MTTSPLTKTSQVWEKSQIWETLNTSSEESFTWITSSDGVAAHFLSKCDSGAKCVQLDTQGIPKITGRIDIEEDEVTAVTSSPLIDSIDKLIVFTAHKSSLVRSWIGTKFEEPTTGQLAFKSDHKGPILQLKVLNNDKRNNQLVTIGSDYMIKIWNIETRHCLSVLRGITSVPLCVEKYENVKNGTGYLACGLVDGNAKLWRMKRDEETSSWMVSSSNVAATTLTKHNSQVPTIAFNEKSTELFLITCGRDQLIAVWDIKSDPETPKCVRLIPTMEEIERVIIVSADFVRRITKNLEPGKSSKNQIMNSHFDEKGLYCVTGGQKGKLRVWELSSGREVNINEGHHNIQGVGLQSKISDLHMASDEETLYFLQDDVISQVYFGVRGDVKEYDVNLTSTNQHEVLDFAVLSDFLIVATTSNVLKVYDFSDSNQGKLVCVSSDANGHSDAILAVSDVLEVKNEHFVTCGKDHSVCLWNLVNEGNKVKMKVLGKGIGHASYVGAVTATMDAIYSASKDGVLKLWGWPHKTPEEQKEEDSILSLSSKRNIAAHTSEINCLSCSPDGEHVASGSQDKTIKIWRANDLALISTLSGHRRGIWCAKFFRDNSSQQILLVTASADSNVKLWNKTTSNSYSCVHTLEGHLSSVLSVTALPTLTKEGGGTKLASVSSDGLLKIWTSENHWNGDVGSFDAHDDKIWAVECVAKDKIITGGRDGQMILWENVTKSVREQERVKQEELVKGDQRLNNYLINGKLSKALKLSLKMNKPRLTKRTLHTLQKRGQLDDALQKLSLDERNVLFQSLVQWNSFANESSIVQDILKYLITDSLANGQSISADQCAGLIAYSEKHYERLDKLQSRLAVVDLLLDTM